MNNQHSSQQKDPGLHAQSHATTVSLHSQQASSTQEIQGKEAHISASGDSEMQEPSTAVKRPFQSSDAEEVRETQKPRQKGGITAAIKGSIFQVKGPDAKYYPIAYHPRKTIGELKEELVNILHLNVEDQSLRVNEKVLSNDSCSLAAYSITDKTTVECYSKQLGGSKSEELEESIGALKHRDYAAESARHTNAVTLTKSGSQIPKNTAAVTAKMALEDTANKIMGDNDAQCSLGSLNGCLEKTHSSVARFEKIVVQPSPKLPLTCPGSSLRGPAHASKEEGEREHPTGHVDLGELAESRTTVPLSSNTLKEVNKGIQQTAMWFKDS